MIKEVVCLNSRITDLKRDLRSAEKELESLQLQCRHDWTITYTPIIREGYEYGDPPGVGGSDHIPRSWVPSQTTPCWTRTCGLCGTKHTTTAIETKPVAGSIPGTKATQEVPVF